MQMSDHESHNAPKPARLAHTAVALCAAAAFSLACATNTGTIFDDKRTQGAIAGTLAGAAIGAAVDGHKRGRGAAIGAAVGGLTGAGVGYYLERQAQEIDAIPDANVEIQQDQLLVAFPSDVLFDVDSRSLSPGAFTRLNQLAETLKRHPQSQLVVKGHTDGTGSETHNLRLSEDRANAVKTYLIAQGVTAQRITALGFGESMPLATNQTEAGRQQNRRVEIEIRPTNDIREAPPLS